MVRINNLEFRKYTSTKVDTILYEIIKWETNPYYNKENQYRDNGYVDSFGGDFLQKDKESIDKIHFKYPETCYTIANVKQDSENHWMLISVGENLTDLSNEEWNDLYHVYLNGINKIKK